jgi:hypothetical protein
MSSPLNKSSSSKFQLSVQTIVLAGIAWAVLAFLFFLLFSVPLPGEGRTAWYRIGTFVFEEVAYLSAAFLCFRNWRSSQIVSGRFVWLGIGLGTLSFFIANLFFTYQEEILRLPLDSSLLGNIFNVLTYIFLIWGISLAVASRRLNLEVRQWIAILFIALVGFSIAAWLTFADIDAAPAFKSGGSPTQQALVATTPNSTLSSTTGGVQGSTKAAKPNVPAASGATRGGQDTATSQDQSALGERLSSIFNTLYTLADVVLLVLATTLLLAFWGGRFSQSWRMIAAGALSLYIADLWFAYASKVIPDYESGELPEVCWVFSGIFFAIGAALEYNLSTRSRRTSGRRRA